MLKADNLPPSCAVVTKSGNLNFLEPSGPVQACNGPALPLYKIYLIFLHPVGVLIVCNGQVQSNVRERETALFFAYISQASGERERETG